MARGVLFTTRAPRRIVAFRRHDPGGVDPPRTVVRNFSRLASARVGELPSGDCVEINSERVYKGGFKPRFYGKRGPRGLNRGNSYRISVTEYISRA
jgi:hypothetical protein